MMWLAVLALGIIAGTIGAVIGFGGSNILIPVLNFAFGPKDAVPIMGVAASLANLSRVMVWWREVDWRAAFVYAMTGIPAVALGARVFLALDARLVELGLGLFMLAMIPVRRWLLRRNFSIGLLGLAIAGGSIGFLTGLVSTTGPINTPFFLAYGLAKGAFIATEALGSLAVHLTKSTVFQQAGALPWDTLTKGLMIGGSMMIGAWLARPIVARLETHQFQWMMDVVMAVAGLAMIFGALSGLHT